MHYVIKKIVENGFKAYTVGGSIRDKFLGRKSSDIDISTNARPEEIEQVFVGYNVKTVGKSFGVVFVDGIEVATFRKDRYYGLSDKEVEISYSDSIEEDLGRRDFTINAIAEDQNGNIIDPFGGINDIKFRTLKFVGDPKKRIYEDPNRIFRALRFTTVLDLMIENNTWVALKEYSHLHKHVASERIRKEILKTLSSIDRASELFYLMYDFYILETVFPSLHECYGIEQNKYHKENLFDHCMIAGDSISKKFPILKLAGYLHDVGKVPAKKYDKEKKDYTFIDHQILGADMVVPELRALKFSNEEIKRIYNTIKFHMRTCYTEKAARKLLRDFEEAGMNISDYLRLKIADRKGNLAKNDFDLSYLRRITKLMKGKKREEEAFSIKDLEVNGFDVMNTLHIGPSIRVGEVLKDLLDIAVDTPEANTRKILLEIIRRRF